MTVKDFLEKNFPSVDGFIEWFIHDPRNRKTLEEQRHEEMMAMLRKISNKQKSGEQER
jgi:hypothetical protein